MSKPGVDIEQIEKYLNGELDAQAMHRLERQALDNPFLAEALEGYQQAGKSQRTNLADLSARLNQRTKKKETLVIPMRYLSAAASVLIICSAGIWWFTRINTAQHPAKVKQPVIAQIAKAPAATDTVSPTKAVPKPEQVASNPSAAQAPAPVTGTAKKDIITAQPPATQNTTASVQADKMAANKPAMLREVQIRKPETVSQYAAPKDTAPLDETIVMNYKSNAHPADTSLFVRKSKLKISNDKLSDTATEHRLVAQAKGVKIYPGSLSQADLNKAIEQGQLGALSSQSRLNPVISGKVINLDNGLPVKGALVKVMGTNQATQTDAKGYFKLQADTTKGRLVVTNRGYHARQVSANTKDSLKMIVLAPNNSDGVEDDLDSAGTGETAPYVTAHPEKGWGSYRRYLKQGAVSPDAKTGIVKISLTVDKNGLISNIKVIKGLSDATNKKAISLVKNGPAWTGSTDKKVKTIILKIAFGK